MADEQLKTDERASSWAWCRATITFALPLAVAACSAGTGSQIREEPSPDWLEFRQVAHERSSAFPIAVNHRFERDDGEEWVNTYYAAETPFLTAADVRIDEVTVEDEPDLFEPEDREQLVVTDDDPWGIRIPFLTPPAPQVDVITVKHDLDPPGLRIVLPLKESGRERMRQFTTDNHSMQFGVFVRNELIRVVTVNCIVDSDVVYLRGLPNEKAALYHARITGAVNPTP